MTDIGKLLKENYTRVAARLTEYMDSFDKNADWKRCPDAMKYSLIAGGKAIRPFICVEFSKLFGGDENLALNFGCAVEMIHASSLIHDDLPAMDNDDMRRGRPSCHKQFDEYTAILAGDSLLVNAFDMITQNTPAELCAEAVKILSDCAGPKGMMGGQQLDLEYESAETVTEEMLIEMCSMKTGALIKAACTLGVLSAKSNMSENEYKNAVRRAVDYAHGIGLAFQIFDDVLDVVGDESVVGKPIGSDAENGKTTFVTLLGLETAKKKYCEYTDKAISTVKDIPGSEVLTELAEALINRNK